MTTDLETLFRIVNVIAGVLAGTAVLFAVRVTEPRRAERWGMVGGGLLCYAVALGTLGRLLGWRGETFLPVVTVCLLYIAGGRLAQIVKARRDR